jgi:L-ascorbate metabolism protein UlaG (beta-lactamase superfamily)
MRTRSKVLLGVGLFVALLLQGVTALYLTGWTAMGTRASGERLARMQANDLWEGDRFGHILPQVQAPMSEMLDAWIHADNPHATPAVAPPFVARSAADFAEFPASGLRITWLGHSTLLIEIDGRRVLVDPVWGRRVSPFAWLGPERWVEPPLPFEELPPLDAVVISHDHYDHLDFPTILRLAEAHDAPFFVPLGVGAHLEYWDVPAERIVEREWWQEATIGDLRLVALPARHFSGRSMMMRDRDCTLWAGWAFIGPRHRVWYSGDTAMFPGIAEIGRRLGPFDATMVESGAYNAMWADVHLGPEQAVQAHRMARGGVMLPVHWGLFDLAMHSWTEPMERVLAAAQEQGVTVVAPRIGESFEPATPPPVERWWPDVPWRSAAAAPQVSSHLDGMPLLD